MSNEQSLNNLMEDGFSFDMSLLKYGDSFHSDDESEYTKQKTDAMNNSNALINDESTSPTLTSAWLNDPTLFGNNSQGFVAASSDAGKLTGKSENGDTANEFSILPCYMNWINNPLSKVPTIRTPFPITKPLESNNGQQVSKNEDVMSKRSTKFKAEVDEPAVSPKKQKLKNELTAREGKDKLAMDVDAINEILKRESREFLPSEVSNFSESKVKQSSMTVSRREEKSSIPTAQRRRKRRFSKDSSISDAVDGLETPSPSKGRTSNRRSSKTISQTGLPSESNRLSPVPSPDFAEVPTSSSIDTTRYISNAELVALSTKDLNRQVKSLPRHIVGQIKHQRRTLKNRGYARSCREKKISETNTLQKSNADLEKELADIKLELHLVELDRDDWKKKYEDLFALVTSE